MALSDEQILDEVNLALGPDLSLVRTSDDALLVVETVTAREWPLMCTPAELAARARDLDQDGIFAGVGGPPGSGAVSPGAALLSIHLDETVWTAAPGARRLVLTTDGARAVP